MTIFYGQWQSYPWKSELVEQSKRVAVHYAEMLADNFESEHNPLDMLDRAINLTAFAVRRLFEKRLVTDELARVQIQVRTFRSRGSGEFREPFISHRGGSAFQNYHFESPDMTPLKISDIANEIIHSSQIMLVRDEAAPPPGLLIASDMHQKDRLLHFTIEEFSAIAKQVLDDQVGLATDYWDAERRKVRATRD